MTGGYWSSFYEPTAEEIAESDRRSKELARLQKERAEAVTVASAELARARTVTEITRVLRCDGSNVKYNQEGLDVYDEASCLSAWHTLVQSDVFPATYDLVQWKARFREWEFYFRWLPVHVVRATRRSRQPLWEVPGKKAWVCASGNLYRIPVTTSRPELRDGLLEVGLASYGEAVVPCGERFRTEHRRPDWGGRPEHYVVGGFQVELAGRGVERVSALHLVAFLS
jgi:hypothetical protein